MNLNRNTDKNSKVFGKQVRIIKRFFFFRLGIKPNYNTTHELKSLFQLLLYCFMNQTSAEESSQQLRRTYPDFLIASADTLLRRLKDWHKIQHRTCTGFTMSTMKKQRSEYQCIC